MWLKRDKKINSVQEFIEKNTGMNIDDFFNVEENPFIFGLSEAVSLAKKEILSQKAVRIMADYDVDGVVSGLIMYKGLKAYGVQDVSVRFPRRFSEGYGLSFEAIEEMPENSLLITVDNGISCIEQIQRAKEKNITVIVTDHHLRRKDGMLPNADVICDPAAIEGSEFKYYCGAAIAYRFIETLLEGSHKDLLEKLLVFTSIATVADVVPLVGANRAIVKRGLQLINKGVCTKGLKAILEQAQIAHVREDDYGFYIGPIINAPGRLYDKGAQMIFEFLLEDECSDPFKIFDYEDELQERAKEFEEINNERKRMVKERIENIIAQMDKNLPSVLVVRDDNISIGIAGNIASNLSTKYHRPAIVITKVGNLLKGSGRSYGNIDLEKIVRECSNYLCSFGGHPFAIGLSLTEKNFDNFICELAKHSASIQIDENDYYDLEISMSDYISIKEEIEKYAPFGEQNPRPIVKMDYQASYKQGNVSFYRFMGEENEHLKLFGELEALGFNKANDYRELGYPKDLYIIGVFSDNYYQGKLTPQIRIMDFWKKQEKTSGIINDLAKLLN